MQSESSLLFSQHANTCSVPSQINPVHAISSYFLPFHFNIAGKKTMYVNLKNICCFPVQNDLSFNKWKAKDLNVS